MNNPAITASHPLHQAPPGASHRLLRLKNSAKKPFESFLQIEAASGILLVLAATIALTWANSPWSASYVELWQTPLGIRVGGFAFERTLEWFVNDVLMVIFFFVVGMEIKWEVAFGELSDWRRAVLPCAAALGGMVVPAAFYLAFAQDAGARSGWAIPMATDIAFALGVLTLLGKRVPPALRVLLLALAVIDDLGAIVVIAAFYSSGISVFGVGVAITGLIGIVALQRFGVRHKVAYIAPAVVVWAGTYAAGVHPTIAGVIVGLLTPVQVWLGVDGFGSYVHAEVQNLIDQPDKLSTHELAARLRGVDMARREAMSPAESLIDQLHPWVAYAIMPIFALANAGVSIGGTAVEPQQWGVALAVGAGLVLGKPIGILVVSWLTLRLGVATLPAELTTRHVIVLGVVAGIGFTMSLFIAQLAFANSNFLTTAKLGILAASGVAAALALILGRLLLRNNA